MRVTRIEVFGFKSFMERLVLPLEGGITGVVGPNGCGKSNIVDALRWVLGETRASNLRGDVLEDVIFNGTDKLRPLGLAEVTITLRSRGENFFVDLLNPHSSTELIALLEKIPFNKDVEVESNQEELEGSEKRVPHLTVIEGHKGKSDEELAEQVIENKSEETISSSEVIHDAAVNLEKKSETEEENLEIAPTALLNRFSWLKSANEVQITRRLYRSGESEFFINRVNCRLKDIKDLLRAVGLGPRSYTIVAQGEVGRIITAKPEDRRMIIEEAAGTLGLRDRVASAKRRLEETNQNLARLNDVIGEVSRQVSSLKRQATRAQARKEIKDRVAVLERSLFCDHLVDFRLRAAHVESELGNLINTESQIDTQLKSAQADEEAARASLLNIDISGDGMRSKIDSIREDLNSRERARYQKGSRLNELKASSLATQDEIRRLEERKALLEQRREEVQNESEALKIKYDTLSTELASIERGDEDALRVKSALLATLRESFKAKEHEIRQIRENISSARGSLDEVNKQIVAMSPLTQLQKTLGQGESGIIAQIKQNTKLFADGLRVPEQYAKAVQALLAEKTAFIVAENPHDIARVFVKDVLRDPKIQKAGLGLGALKAGQVASELETAQDSQIPFPTLLSKIEIEQSFGLAARETLGNAYLAESLDEAIAFFEATPVDGIKIVTKDGEILTQASFFTLRHEGGIIQMRNRADELESKVKELEQLLSGHMNTREQIAAEVTRAEEEHRMALEESQARQAKVRELAKEQGSVKGRLDASVRLLDQVAYDIERAEEQNVSAKQKVIQYSEQTAVVENELKALTSDDEAQLKDELSQLASEYAKLEPIRKEGRLKLSQCSNRVEIARKGLDDIRSKISHATLEREKVDLERTNLRDKISTEYGVDLLSEVENAALNSNKITQEEKEAQQDEVSKLKARIIREGDVDPTSIQQYEDERIRLEDLEKQRADLESATVTLHQTIVELTQTSQDRFLETFNAVKANYEKLVPRLFGGGKGTIELTDLNRPLEAGVEILVRPPGKKPKSIELLSGGEKALCATALIFSMFMVRPSPLCVLDEVDAPLDDANLVRLLSVIKEMSKQTQFLVITHNKQSMSVADNLVGVTMQEPGATRIITVSLQEAYKQAI